MNCELPKKRLHEYLDGALSPDESAGIKKHLQACPDCSGYLADLRETLKLTASLKEVEPPAWLTRKIMTKVKEEKAESKGLLERLFGGVPFRLPLTAAAVLVVAVTAVVLMKSMEPDVQKVLTPSAPQQMTDLRKEAPLESRTRQTPAQDESVKGAEERQKKAAQKPLPAVPRVSAPQQPTAGLGPQSLQPIQPEKAVPLESRDADEHAQKLRENSVYAPAPGRKEEKTALPLKDQAMHQSAPAPATAGAPARMTARKPAGIASESDAVAGKMDSSGRAAGELSARPAAKGKREESEITVSLRQVITERHENGKPRAAVTFRIISGESKKFFEERFDDQGRRHGVHTAYDREGRISAEVGYEHGEIGSIREYNADGSLRKGEPQRNWPWLHQ